MQLKLISIGVALLFLMGVVWSIYHKGYAQCELDMKAAQVEHEKKVRKKYDKIDKATPFNKSMHDKLEWLFQYGRDESEPQS